MPSRCQGEARASCSPEDGELEAEGGGEAGRICGKKSGSLDSQGQDQVQGQ